MRTQIDSRTYPVPKTDVLTDYTGRKGKTHEKQKLFRKSIYSFENQ